MTISYVGRTFAQHSNPVLWTEVLPSGMMEGDLIIAVVNYKSSDAGAGFTPSAYKRLRYSSSTNLNPNSTFEPIGVISDRNYAFFERKYSTALGALEWDIPDYSQVIEITHIVFRGSSGVINIDEQYQLGYSGITVTPVFRTVTTGTVVAIHFCSNANTYTLPSHTTNYSSSSLHVSSLSNHSGDIASYTTSGILGILTQIKIFEGGEKTIKYVDGYDADNYLGYSIPAVANVPEPLNLLPGDRLFAFVSMWDYDYSPSITPPAGWVLIGSYVKTVGTEEFIKKIFTKVVTAPNSSGVWYFDGLNTTSQNMRIVAYRGISGFLGYSVGNQVNSNNANASGNNSISTSYVMEKPGAILLASVEGGGSDLASQRKSRLGGNLIDDLSIAGGTRSLSMTVSFASYNMQLTIGLYDEPLAKSANPFFRHNF